MNTHNKLVPTTAFTLLALAVAQELNAQIVDPLPVSRSVESLRVLPAEINAVNFVEGLEALSTCGDLSSVVFEPLRGECDEYGGGTTRAGITCVLNPVTQEVQWSVTGSQTEADVQGDEVVVVYTENCTDDEYGGPCDSLTRINERGRTLVNGYIYPSPISTPGALESDAELKLCDRAFDQNDNLICGAVPPYFITICFDNNLDETEQFPVPPCPESAGCPTDLPSDDVSRSVISVTRISNNGEQIISDKCLCVSPNDPNPPDELTPCDDTLLKGEPGSCYNNEGTDGVTNVPSDEKMSGEFYCLDIGVLRYCWDINP